MSLRCAKSELCREPWNGRRSLPPGDMGKPRDGGSGDSGHNGTGREVRLVGGVDRWRLGVVMF